MRISLAIYVALCLLSGLGLGCQSSADSPPATQPALGATDKLPFIRVDAKAKQVRVECNKPIVDSDRPVFVLRRP